MTGRRQITLAVLAALAACGPAGAAGPGRITGTVDRPGDVTAVHALDRAGDKKYPGRFDARTGKFAVDGLPNGVAYDLVIDAGPARLEGANLKVPRSDYEEEQPLTAEDVAAIKKIARDLNKFENEVEVLAVAGNAQHAAAVLNKRRTKDFYDAKPGQIVWRLELWHFDKPEEHWIKSQEELGLVYYRERIQQADYDKKAITLDPGLGGLTPTENRPVVELGRVVLPSKGPGVRLRQGGVGGK